MKELILLLLLTFLAKLYPGETLCGKDYSRLSSMYNIKNDIAMYMNSTATMMTESSPAPVFQQVNNSARLQNILSEHRDEDSEFNIPDNTICATLLLRNYTTSYFGWSWEQINTCGPYEKAKCDSLIKKEAKSGIVIHECYNYPCTKDGCTAKFVVKKSFTNNQYVLWSATMLLIFIMAVVFHKYVDVDSYDSINKNVI